MGNQVIVACKFFVDIMITSPYGDLDFSNFHIIICKCSYFVNTNNKRPVYSQKKIVGQHTLNAADGILHLQVGIILPVNHDIILPTFNVGNVIQKYLHHFPVGPEVQEPGIVSVCSHRFDTTKMAELIDSLNKSLK